ncbi:DNA/RNA nuclease SfsA [Rhodococcus erythropolis]|uniref:DNA/RNA nuclease SfsA n=1 Tax=Rhodococcus erythropolis TaxID=1833 RepID=UPI002109DB23|nr:DNA/RNA nuclease SfsA [Rhodococcus erythropolis]MCQ4125244.1 DNA/RNA nuclease SfsA [Rhodococcus erythropolis]
MLFDNELQIGQIIRRPNRFIIDVEIEGRQVACHCPTTGRIGNLVLDGLPCMLSPSDNPKRKTRYTVEAISVDPPATATDNLRWVGINQNAANRYVEAALTADLVPEMITAGAVRREQTLGASRLDFLVDDDTYIEVKTPLQDLQIDVGPHIQTRKAAPFDSTDRFVKHFTELGASLGIHQRALLAVCFLYDNPGFVVHPSVRHDAVAAQVAVAVEQGVEIWQINFELDRSGVKVLRCVSLTDRFVG